MVFRQFLNTRKNLRLSTLVAVLIFLFCPFVVARDSAVSRGIANFTRQKEQQRQQKQKAQAQRPQAKATPAAHKPIRTVKKSRSDAPRVAAGPSGSSKRSSSSSRSGSKTRVARREPERYRLSKRGRQGKRQGSRIYVTAIAEPQGKWGGYEKDNPADYIYVPTPPSRNWVRVAVRTQSGTWFVNGYREGFILMVPARAVAEHLGVGVKLDKASGQIILSRDPYRLGTNDFEQERGQTYIHAREYFEDFADISFDSPEAYATLTDKNLKVDKTARSETVREQADPDPAPFTILVNGKEFMKVPDAIGADGKLVMPLKDLLRALGASVHQDQGGRLHAQRGSWEHRFKDDATGRLRDWAKVLGVKVEPNSAEKTINLIYPSEIFIARNGQRYGPYSLEYIEKHLASGHLSSTDQAWYEGALAWVPLSQVPGVKVPQVTSNPEEHRSAPLTGSARMPAPTQQHDGMGYVANGPSTGSEQIPTTARRKRTGTLRIDFKTNHHFIPADIWVDGKKLFGDRERRQLGGTKVLDFTLPEGNHQVRINSTLRDFSKVMETEVFVQGGRVIVCNAEISYRYINGAYMFTSSLSSASSSTSGSSSSTVTAGANIKVFGDDE
jgi:hypothetical protein